MCNYYICDNHIYLVAIVYNITTVFIEGRCNKDWNNIVHAAAKIERYTQ